MTRPTCSSCIHWLGTTTVDVREAAITTLPGDCRASSPQLRGGWPQTRGTDWCGAHEDPHPAPELLFAMGVRS